MYLPRHPCWECFRMLRGIIIVLEGIVCAGKSTAGSSLSDYLNRIGIRAKYFPEYTNDFLLSLFLKDMKTNAFAFQMFMLSKRIDVYKEAERFAKKGYVVIMDRSLVGDKTFCSLQKDCGNISEEQWDSYVNTARKEAVLTPSIIVYIECDSKKALGRVGTRGNSSEIKGYNVEYFENLSLAYEESLSNTTVPVLRYPTEKLSMKVGEVVQDQDCLSLLRYIKSSILR